MCSGGPGRRRRVRLRPPRLSPCRRHRGRRGLHHPGRRAAGAADPARRRAVPGSLGAAGRLRAARRGSGSGRGAGARGGDRPAPGRLAPRAARQLRGAGARPPHAGGHRCLLGDLLRSARAAGRRRRPGRGPDAGGTDRARRPVRLAFDHERIVRDAVERTRSKLEYTALAARFCPPEFTIAQLRRVYETVWNTRLDPGNFQRGVQESGAFERHLEAPPAPQSGRGRPASLWSVSAALEADEPAAPLARPPARRRRPGPERRQPLAPAAGPPPEADAPTESDSDSPSAKDGKGREPTGWPSAEDEPE